MIRGFRTSDKAIENAQPNFHLPQHKRVERWNQKQPIYSEYESLYPGVEKAPDEPDTHSIFWRDHIINCPAYRSDRTTEPNTRCNSMAILVHRDEEGLLIFCPECLYAGEDFKF